jgi:hypothetical protein
MNRTPEIINLTKGSSGIVPPFSDSISDADSFIAGNSFVST